MSQLRRLRRRTECKTLRFETPWKNPAHGWPQSSRAYARALDMVGVKVQLLDWNEPRPPCEDVCRVIPERMRVPDPLWLHWDAKLFSCPLGSREAHRGYRTFEMFRETPRPRLFYTMFERRSVEADLVEELNLLDAMFVPCTANLEVLDRCGCRTASYVPYPYFDDDPLLSLPPPRKQPRTFLWIGRWEPRKAPHNLIEAFHRAFKRGEAELILKLGPSPWTRSDYPSPENILRELKRDDVLVIRDTLSADAMIDLHAHADVYVSASRGEGIELGMYSAKLAGRRVVTTDCGGPRDFLGEHDVLVPSTGDVLAPEYDWLWGPGAKYADYDVDELVAALQSVMTPWTPPEEDRVPPRNRAERVGHRLKAWIENALAGTR